ncbi:MAG: FadR/GntR family transcriptional regulator [Desulfarculaceae bacterium]|jgi:GntR family transcriptional repressor for pyruvate dehydrogenase complex
METRFDNLESALAGFHTNRRKQSKAYSEIVEAIWDAIEDQNLSPGDKLPSEKELSKILNVARPTLREALSVLQYVGVVDCVQGGGYYVKSLIKPTLSASLVSLSRNVSIYHLVIARLAVEPEACRLAATSRKIDDILHMRQLLDKVSGKPAPGEYPIAIDTAFHAALGRASGNPLIASVVETLLSLRNQAWALYKTLQAGGRGMERYLRDVKQDHELVFKAVKDGDEEAAYLHMRNHLLQVKTHLFGDSSEDGDD